ncbi:hypothetical protein [Geitlerinema sp. PCC 7407]|uniref:hypothetical protein n=1 Tax=Geitlerinema sp. PCC 7407 TaxID=1173025 RepID=UPI00029FF481|nr:hypothetical protein [Geitlerinema sp. PCC 7407]AFY67938.1 hypothetical protein GEI7407_3471 [Geitlerinema sp. PCC 7407]
MNDKCSPGKDYVLRSVATISPSTYHQSPLHCLHLVDKHEAASLLGISAETLKKYRLQKGSTLIEGIHYHIWNSRVIRYNALLLADWGLHRNNPEAHRKAIEAYLATLPCNQPKKRGRKAG